MLQINFNFRGAETIEALKEKHFVFQNNKVPVIEKDNRTLIQKSKTISPELKQRLENLDGILYLSRVSGKYGNIHLLTNKATCLDGIERLGYIRGNRDTIQFVEYPRGKNAHYSSFYPLVKELLLANGFKEKSNGFYISANQIDLFVGVINRFIKERDIQNYQPVIDSRIDTMIIDSKKYFFNVLYWDEQKRQQEGELMNISKPGQEFINIKNSIQMLAEICRNAKEEKDLQIIASYINEIRKRLDILESITQREAKQLEEYRALFEE